MADVYYSLESKPWLLVCIGLLIVFTIGVLFF